MEEARNSHATSVSQDAVEGSVVLKLHSKGGSGGLTCRGSSSSCSAECPSLASEDKHSRTIAPDTSTRFRDL